MATKKILSSGRSKAEKKLNWKKTENNEGKRSKERKSMQTDISKSHKNYPKCLFKRANVSDYRVGVHPVLLCIVVVVVHNIQCVYVFFFLCGFIRFCSARPNLIATHISAFEIQWYYAYHYLHKLEPRTENVCVYVCLPMPHHGYDAPIFQIHNIHFIVVVAAVFLCVLNLEPKLCE